MIEQRRADAPAATVPRIDALEIARRLGLPAPTNQQRAVIEAPMTPALVVAGAGSGKTETMSLRVLWLLANGLVTPPQILGLTFTRKAASELAERIRRRVGRLHDAHLTPKAYDPFEPPHVSTYNAFANGIYRDYATVIGREPGGVVLGEASAWQLARRVVIESTESGLGDLDIGVDAITQCVLGLAAELGEHDADGRMVEEWSLRYRSALDALPFGRSVLQGDFDTVSRPAVTLPMFLGLATEFGARKQAIGAVQYSDQVSLALRILDRAPELVGTFRDRYRVVLLDEYQDTSVVQTRLLARLFGGTPVMAVGDPHQSIYGWRGASAANLEHFAGDFGPRGSAAVYALNTSWRNGTAILDAANAIAAPLTSSAKVAVERLVPSPAASEFPVECMYSETIDEEAVHIAEWFRDRLAEPVPQRDGSLAAPSAALLLRTRSTLPTFLAEFRRLGVPYHVLGVGDLLREPEIADLVSALRVVHSAQAGAELVRLLAGSAWRIGPADLVALQRLARWLEQRDFAEQRLGTPVLEAFGRSLAEGESGSIVDALDFVARRPGHPMLSDFSDAGRERLVRAGRTFADLRARAGGDLPEFVRLVVETLALDIEVLANEARAGLAPLQAFDEALAGYLTVAEGATLGGFLGWLTLAEHKEDLSPRSDPPESGTVQVLTVHGSKGLEWDLVAVPRLVAGELPSKPKSTLGWLRAGALPWEFRGDAEELPMFGWPGLADRAALKQELARYRAAVGEHLLAEERRLAYVAVTRARHRLLLTGSFWASQRDPRPPSDFLGDLANAGVIGALPKGPQHADRPEDAPPETFVWPRDPLGGRRAGVTAAAAAVRAAAQYDPEVAGRWRAVVDSLLTERAELLAGGADVPVPDRIPASRFKDYIDDPHAVASSLRRPMPQKPYAATRLGTLFHEWVEQRAGRTGVPELVDAFAAERDDDLAVFDDGLAADSTSAAEPATDAALAALQQRFAASPWGSLAPIEVEREIQLPFAGHIVVCKIDAVYRRNGRFEIVDWKTGRSPANAADLALKQFQLALYRLAYARTIDVAPESIDAVFYYVAEDRVVRPDRISSEAELLSLWEASLATPSMATGPVVSSTN